MTTDPQENSTIILEGLLDRYARRPSVIDVDFRALVPWVKAGDQCTHFLHPYPAKLLPHIAHLFVANRILSSPGSLVLDPFCGSGTVLVESILSQRPAIGVDVNPLACLISQVKTTELNPSSLKSATWRLLDRVEHTTAATPPDVVNLQYWFYPHVVRQLSVIRAAIRRTRNVPIRRFFEVCFSKCARRVSLADPRLSVPVRLSEDQYSPNHSLYENTSTRLRQLRRVNVVREFSQIVESNAQRLKTLAKNGHRAIATADVVRSDARHLLDPRSSNFRRLRKNSVELIVTSPPYAGAQKYIRASSLELGWLDLWPSEGLKDLDGKSIGREHFRKGECILPPRVGVRSLDRRLRKIYSVNKVRAHIMGSYISEMREALNESFRVLKPGGHVVLIAGNNHVCGSEFPTQRYLRNIAHDIGLRTKLRLVDTIRSRGLMTKRNRTANLISREWVLLFEKTAHG